jgi:uncharacterized protein YndB with AHSA1/START domain
VFEPAANGAGTRLTLTGTVTSPLPLLDKVGIFIGTNGKGQKRNLQEWLCDIKRNVEEARRNPLPEYRPREGGIAVAAALRHQRSIHIQAPVEKVFHYLGDPARFVAGLAAGHGACVGDVNRAPDGQVLSFDLRYRELGRDKTTVVTTEQRLPNRRIAYHAAAGPVHVFTLEPDAQGTTLTYGWDGPRLLKVLDAIFAHTSKDIERMLAIHKREIEAMP